VSPHVEAGFLAELADGTLAQADAIQVRKHLAECRSCMAAYADAVRYRAAWLAEPEGFALEKNMRSVAMNPSRVEKSVARRISRRIVWPLAAAAAVVVAVIALIPDRSPSLSFSLPPRIREASGWSSATGLVLPGAEQHANDVRPERRSGRTAVSSELEREVQTTIDAYEDSARGPESGARVVAALLATGEVDAASDYSRECLRRRPRDVPLLVFAADAGYRSNNLAGAETLLRRAKEVAPRDPVVTLDLALVLRQSGKRDEARALLGHASRSRVGPIAARAKRELAQLPRP